MNDSVKSLVEVSTRTINGKEVLAVTSLQVAKHFGKEHFHVMRDIKNTVDKCSESFNASNFGLVEYTDAINTHCRKANDYRDSEMLPTATPMKIIPESDVYRLVMPSPLLTTMKRVSVLSTPPMARRSSP